jgi:hypothetical protein
MDKLSISDVLLTYSNDSDKIAILGRAIEMMLDYTDKIEQSFSTVNENIRMIAEAITTLGTEVKRIDSEMLTLKGSVSSDISKLVDEVKETAAVVATATPVAAPSRASAHKTSISEENLMKPSSFGKSLGEASGGPMGGGMSIRSAMMAEIKQKLHGPSGSTQAASSAAAADSSEGSPGEEKSGEIGGGYIPSIQKPREAKTIEGGLVSKMNKLLETKFKAGAGAGEPSGAGPLPAGPPKGSKAGGRPPSAGPSKGSKASRASAAAEPPKGQKAAKSAKSSPGSFPPTAAPPKIEEKTVEKKKEKKEKKKDTQLSDLERKIREKLG